MQFKTEGSRSSTAPAKAVILVLAVMAGTAGKVAAQAPAANEPAPVPAVPDGEAHQKGYYINMPSGHGALIVGNKELDDPLIRWRILAQANMRMGAEATSFITAVAFSPGGSVVVSGSDNGDIKLWKVPEKSRHRQFEFVDRLGTHDVEVKTLAWSAKGNTLATLGVRRAKRNERNPGMSRHVPEVKIWDMRAEELRTVISDIGPDGAWIDDMALSPDGRLVAIAAFGKPIKLWDCATGKPLQDLAGPVRQGVVKISRYTSVAFSPDGKIIAAAGYGKSPRSKQGETTRYAGYVTLWDIFTGKLLRTMHGPEEGDWDQLTSVAFSPDGNMIAAGSGIQVQPSIPWPEDRSEEPRIARGEVKIWNVLTGQLLHTLKGHTKQVHKVIFAPTGQWLASSSDDQTIRLWNPYNGREMLALTGWDDVPHSRGVLRTTGQSTYRAEAPRYYVRQIIGGKAEALPGGKTPLQISDTVFGLAFSPDGRWLATGGTNGTVKLWPLAPQTQEFKRE